MKCDSYPASMATVAALLGRNALPQLRSLWLDRNSNMGNGGVAALARGLLDTRTNFRAGRFEKLERFHMSRNVAVSGEGVCVLAWAIEEASKEGLPLLSRFSAGL